MANSSECVEMNRRADTDIQSIETFHVIWLITNVNDEMTLIKENAIMKLRLSVNYSQVFNDRDACIDYITEFRTKKFFLILSNHVGEQMVPLINQIDQIDSIYIYFSDEIQSITWTKFYKKISGIFTDINSICEQLNKDTRRCMHNLLSMSSIPFVSTTKYEKNERDVSFIYTQLIRELFCDMYMPEQALRDMLLHFEFKFEGNQYGLALVDEMDRDYYSNVQSIVSGIVQPGKSIRWYTRCNFIFEVLNQALRMQDIDTLYKMRYFIVDIHKQLRQLYIAQSKTKVPLIVYRGQAMSNEEFERHKSNLNGLLMVNNFFSTTTDRNVAEAFALANKGRLDMQAILFEIELDPNISGEQCPFARIEHISYFQTEHEVLISMGGTFRICSIDKNNNDIWNMHLKLTDKEYDRDLEKLADNIWNKIQADYDLFRLIKLLRLMKDFEKAKKYMDMLLSESLFCDYVQNFALVINEIGLIYEGEGDFATAYEFYELFMDMKRKRQLIYMTEMNSSTVPQVTILTIKKHIEDMKNQDKELIRLKNSLEREEKTNGSNAESLARYCQQIGGIYEEQENYTEALKMYEKSLQLFLPVDSKVIRIYSSMALLYAKQNNWSISNIYIEKVLEQYSHIKSVMSYEKIALAYELQERYDDAIGMYEKILSIIPDDDENYEIPLINIGYVYEKQQNYVASLEKYKYLLNLQLDIYYPYHHKLADTYASIARVLYSQHKYQESYMNLTNALNIDLITMSSNHPWIKRRQAEIDAIQQKI
jgi:tetratricopeptide (TPR) repeat protein